MNLLLLGAGFSRNWGGWLADELTGDLLARLEGFPNLADMLRESRDGFEGVLSDLYVMVESDPSYEHLLREFQRAVLASFEEMNGHFTSANLNFEFSQNVEMTIGKFLAKFDAIYTLNQDLLLEAKYVPPLGSKYSSVQYPGLKRSCSGKAPIPSSRVCGLLGSIEHLTPESDEFSIEREAQPIFKLHGSTNWLMSDDRSLLIMGGNKGADIARVPLLKRYFAQFKEHLNEKGARLMIIGYSFHDAHINNLLLDATANSDLKVFLVDPKGISALVIENSNGSRNETMNTLKLVGVSRRSLRESFTTDFLEHAKLNRFFS